MRGCCVTRAGCSAMSRSKGKGAEMGNRVAAVIGILLVAAYTLFLSLKIGAGVLIAIVLAVLAMAIADAWQGAFRNGQGQR